MIEEETKGGLDFEALRSTHRDGTGEGGERQELS